MILAILATILVLGIASYQVAQGLFSAMIMTLLTILAAVIAFNFYESLGAMLYNNQPAYADAVSLLAIFIVTLLGLRMLYDMCIRGNVVFGTWIDRIGGGAMGIVTGMVMVGMLTIIAQMLPFGRTVFMYQAFDETLKRSSSLAPFYPDEFTLGLVKTLSGGSLSRWDIEGGKPYATVHDDLLLESFCARNDGAKGGRLDARPGTLTVAGAYELKPEMFPGVKDVPAYPLLPDSVMTKPVAVRAVVDETTRDENSWFTLPATQFRLVTNTGKGYYPVAYLTYYERNTSGKVDTRSWKLFPAAQTKDGKTDLVNLMVERECKNEQKNLTVDWVYQLPQDETPSYMVFRKVAKAPVIKHETTTMPTTQPALERIKPTN